MLNTWEGAAEFTARPGGRRMEGQRAMAVAMMYPEGQWKKKVAQNTTLSTKIVQQARTVLKYAPEPSPAPEVGYG
jgi:hypothetical protein